MKKILIVLIVFPLMLNAQVFDGLKKWKTKRKNQKAENHAIERIEKTHQFGNFLQNSQNQNFNDLQYLGFGIFNNSLKVRTLKNWEFQSERGMQFGVESGSTFKNPGGIIQYSRSMLWLKSPNKAFTLGPSAKILINGRLNPSFENNSLSMLSSFNLGLGANFKKKFKVFNSSYQFIFQTKVYPIALGLSAPGYSSSFDHSNISGFFLPHRYQHLQTSFYLNLPAGSRFVNRRYTISYNWNFANLSLGQNRNLIFGNHQIGLIGYLNKIK